MKFKKYNNEEGISSLNLFYKVTVFCPFGQDYSTSFVECKIQINDTYLDFTDVEKYFREELNGKSFTQESLAAEVYNTLKREYNSPNVSVKIINDNPPPSVVVKED